MVNLNMKFFGKQIHILAISIAIATIIVVYFYQNILPSRFPNQHQPKETDITSDFYDPFDTVGIWHGVSADSVKLADKPTDTKVLGQKTGNKRIEIDLTNQRLYAFENDQKIYDFLISSGLYDWTPRGNFRIWIKLRYTKMAGGNKALGTYYYLPNVPYTMYFYNDQVPAWRGFGLHGTYWHNDFGRPKSHGCVNLRTEDAEKLFYWAEPQLNGKSSIRASSDNPGTEIVIYGKYKS